ncbi:MAG: glycosyltransferase [Pseudomonadota bacterium]
MTDGGQDGRAEKPLQIIVGIATTGRPGILAETLQHMATLQDQPDRVIVSIAHSNDADANQIGQLPFPFEIVTSPKGLCEQRNTVLAAVPSDAIVLFLDDDFLISDGFVSATRAVFEEEQDVVMATGTVLADGILGPGLTHRSGLVALAQADNRYAAVRTEVYNAYGCNMAIRMAPVQTHAIRFDQELPLYSWLEDVDFSRCLAAYGRVVKDSNMQGVHLGTKTGRSPGKRLGYSQVANPIYLIRKGTMSPSRALRLMGRNMVANLAKTVRPEPWVDRIGRVRGNFLAVSHLLTGRMSPKRILEL